MAKPKKTVDKAELIRLIVAELGDRFATLEKAARASQAEATHESSKAENKYDTRGLEAAYLAGGQARQAKEILDAVELFKKTVRPYVADEEIDVGALVEVEMNGERNLFYVGPKMGGIEVKCGGREITVITPQSPLGENLVEKTVGHQWKSPIGGRTMVCVVTAIW